MADSVKLSFRFANTFPQANERMPLFLRSSGVAGTLRIKTKSERFDTIKLVLRGMSIMR